MTSLTLSSPLRRRWFFPDAETDGVLMLLAVFSCVLVGVRIVHTGRPTFLFMPWNLFLAWVPYFVSGRVTRRWGVRGDRGRGIGGRGVRVAGTAGREVGVAGLIIWLLFIPNSFYILTDLYHLADNHRSPRVPEWYDLILILSFAWNGLLLGVRSVRQMERLLAPDASLLGRWVFLYPLMWLCALGVYIGRDLRYNSWDIAIRPAGLLSDVFTLIVHPVRHHMEWGMIFCYSILLTIMYSLLWKISSVNSGIGTASC